MDQYALKAWRSAEDGRFYGELRHGATVVAAVVTGGFKDEKELTKWARAEAHSHKASLTPAETHTIEKTFSL